MDKRRIISFLLAFTMMLGTLVNPSMANTSNPNAGKEAKYEIQEIDGKTYKVYKVSDLGLKNPEKLLAPKYRTRAAGDPMEDWVKVKLQSNTVGLTLGDDFDIEVFVAIKRKKTKIAVAKINPTQEKVKDQVFHFVKTAEYDENNPEHLDSDNWYLYVEDNFQYELRFSYGERGNFSDENMLIIVTQRAMPLYKAVWFTNKTERPVVDAFYNDGDNIANPVKLNNTDFAENEYKSFSSEKMPFYVAQKEMIVKEENLGTMSPDDFLVSDMKGAVLWKLLIDQNGEKKTKGTIEDGDTKYHFNITGDFKTPFVATMREELKVTFDPNGAKFDPAVKTEQAIGHSMKIGEAFGDLEAVTVPAKNQISNIPKKDNKDQEFVGWVVDEANKSLDFSDGKNADKLVDPNGYEVKENKTFYAVYAPVPQGKVTIQYVDGNGDAIKDIYKVQGVNYPAEATGNVNEAVDASKIPQPKFIGYERNGDINVAGIKYLKDGGHTVEVPYKKLDSIIPEKKNGQDNPDVTPDVKEHYAKVTFQVDNKDSKKAELQLDGAKAKSPLVYYVNPVEGIEIKDVANVNAVSMNDNLYKVDANNMWTFSSKPNSTITNKSHKINKEKEITLTAIVADKTAAKFIDKLKPVDIKVWKDETDTDGSKINWKKGVKLKEDDKDLQKILDNTKTKYADATTPARNSSKAQKNPFEGTIKITFEDNSTIEVSNQKLYVSEQKVKEKPNTDPEYINPDNLPDNKIKVELKLGEGVKVGNTNGNKDNPVVHSTFYIKPNTGLAETDFPTLDVKSGYKTGSGKWDKDKTTVFPGRLKSDKTYKDESFLATATKLGDGSVKVEYYANGTKIDDISAYKLSGKTYITSKQGKEDDKVTAADLTNDYHDLIGYEKDITKGTGGIEIPANAKYETETANIKTVKFHYKKIDDIIKPSTPNDKIPAGYKTVKFLSDAEGSQNARGELWLKDETQTEAPTEESKLFTELVYYVNPNNATLDLEANKLSGKKANGTEDINVEVYSKVTDGKSKVKLNDSNKYDWDKKPADAIDSNKNVKKDVTLTVQYEALKIAEIITKENLAPETLKVWVEDTIPWKNGVKVADSVTDNTLKATIEGYLKDAKTSYKDNTTPARTSEKEAVDTPKTGTIRVTFSDKSYIDVENQDLYVIPHITSPTNNNTPDDAIEVTFKLGEGVKAGDKTGEATPVEYGKYKVKPNTNLDEYKLEIAGNKATIFQHINAKVTDDTKYTGVVWEGLTANKPEDHVVRSDNDVFTAKASKIFTVTHVFKGIDADKADRPEIAANELPDELKAGENSLIPVDKTVTVKENYSYEPSNITKKVTQTIKDNQDKVTAVYEWTFKEWLNKEELKNISENKTVTGIWERRQATSEKPKIDQPTEGDNKITGKGEPGSKIVVKDKDSNKIGEIEVNEKGEWEVKVPEDKPLKNGDKITVEQTEKGKKPNTDETTVKGKNTPTPSTPTTPTKPETPDRVHGDDRVETAIEISKRYFGQADTVIVVDRKDFPDAMTASVLSKLLKAPILLTETNKLDPRVAAEIKRLGVKDVIIVGGNSSVSEAVKKELAKFDKDNVERIYGKDRYETSAQVARRVVGITGKLGHAVVASGEVFADALTVAPYASREGYPILLVKYNSLPPTVNKAIKDLAITKVTIAGGYKTVSKSLESSLPTVVERLRGDTRYETAIDIATKKFNTNKIFLANGEQWMDALVIGPVGGILDMPILLTPANSAPKSLKDYIAKERIQKITAIGGRSMVSDKVLNELSK